MLTNLYLVLLLGGRFSAGYKQNFFYRAYRKAHKAPEWHLKRRLDPRENELISSKTINAPKLWRTLSLFLFLSFSLSLPPSPSLSPLWSPFPLLIFFSQKARGFFGSIGFSNTKSHIYTRHGTYDPRIHKRVPKDCYGLEEICYGYLLSSPLSSAWTRTDTFNFFGPTASRRRNVDTFGSAIKWSAANQNLSRQETTVFVSAVGPNHYNVSFADVITIFLLEPRLSRDCR